MQPGPRRGPNICPPSLGFLTCQVEAIRVSTSQAGVRTMNENTERLAQGAAQTKCPSVGSHHPLSIAPLISCEEGLQLAELRPGAQWLVVGGGEGRSAHQGSDGAAQWTPLLLSPFPAPGDAAETWKKLGCGEGPHRSPSSRRPFQGPRCPPPPQERR